MGGIIGAVIFWVFGGLLFIIGGAVPSGQYLLVAAAICVIGGFVTFFQGRKKAKIKKNFKQVDARQRELGQKINEIACDPTLTRETLMPVSEDVVSIYLSSGEMAYIQCLGEILITKERAVGRTGGYGGVSVHVARGITLHTGSSSGKTVYGDVTRSYAGSVVVTNERFIFLNEQVGFECKLKDITLLNAYGQDTITMMARNKNYVFNTYYAQYIAKAVSLLREDT